MGGGSGLKYAASTIIYLSKSKEKDGKDVIGNIIKAKTAKSRLSKENQQVNVRLYYDERGLDRYYGLLELGEAWRTVEERRWTIRNRRNQGLRQDNLRRAREVLYARGT